MSGKSDFSLCESVCGCARDYCIYLLSDVAGVLLSKCLPWIHSFSWRLFSRNLPQLIEFIITGNSPSYWGEFQPSTRLANYWRTRRNQRIQTKATGKYMGGGPIKLNFLALLHFAYKLISLLWFTHLLSHISFDNDSQV